MNKHEILANTEKKLSKMTVRKEIEQNEWSGTKAIHNNCIVGYETKNQTQGSRQTQDSGKSLVLIKSLYFP